MGKLFAKQLKDYLQNSKGELLCIVQRDVDCIFIKDVRIGGDQDNELIVEEYSTIQLSGAKNYSLTELEQLVDENSQDNKIYTYTEFSNSEMLAWLQMMLPPVSLLTTLEPVADYNCAVANIIQLNEDGSLFLL